MRSLLAAALLAACNLGGGVGLDAGPADGEAGLLDGGDGAPEASSDARDDAAGVAVDGGPGPVTQVTRGLELSTERLCDLDGDGLGDNAIADLGEPSATLMAAGLNAALRDAIARGNRYVLHLPWVEDRATPADDQVVFIAFSALDEQLCDGPGPDDVDLLDDFDGDEPYCAKVEQLDDCGEPLSVARGARIAAGELTAESQTMYLGSAFPIALSGSRAHGVFSRGARSLTAELCGYATAEALGSTETSLSDTGLSTLEIFLHGGAAMGLPTLPGFSIDIDVDGDGLEGFELDVDGRIERCVDGDGTVIEGNDCWQDARIADGLSLTFEIEAVSASFMGFEDGWDERSCEDVFDSMVGCAGSRWCSDLVARLCGPGEAPFAALWSCVEDRCVDDCAERGDPCRTCAEERCIDELAGCVDAPPCCPEPPEGSAWDPA